MSNEIKPLSALGVSPAPRSARRRGKARHQMADGEITVRTDNTKTLANALSEIDRLRGELRYIADATANASHAAVRHVHDVAARALKGGWESEAGE